MALVPAKCTQCGASIQVDDTNEAGVCEYCGTAFITEKVINNYHQVFNIENASISVQTTDVNNLILRGKQFEEDSDFDKAAEYYNKVLDIDISNQEAISGLKRVNSRIVGPYKITREQFDNPELFIKVALNTFRPLRGWCFILQGIS